MTIFPRNQVQQLKSLDHLLTKQALLQIKITRTTTPFQQYMRNGEYVIMLEKGNIVQDQPSFQDITQILSIHNKQYRAIFENCQTLQVSHSNSEIDSQFSQLSSQFDCQYYQKLQIGDVALISSLMNTNNLISNLGSSGANQDGLEMLKSKIQLYHQNKVFVFSQFIKEPLQTAILLVFRENQTTTVNLLCNDSLYKLESPLNKPICVQYIMDKICQMFQSQITNIVIAVDDEYSFTYTSPKITQVLSSSVQQLRTALFSLFQSQQITLSINDNKYESIVKIVSLAGFTLQIEQPSEINPNILKLKFAQPQECVLVPSYSNTQETVNEPIYKAEKQANPKQVKEMSSSLYEPAEDYDNDDESTEYYYEEVYDNVYEDDSYYNDDYTAYQDDIQEYSEHYDSYEFDGKETSRNTNRIATNTTKIEKLSPKLPYKQESSLISRNQTNNQQTTNQDKTKMLNRCALLKSPSIKTESLLKSNVNTNQQNNKNTKITTIKKPPIISENILRNTSQLKLQLLTNQFNLNPNAEFKEHVKKRKFIKIKRNTKNRNIQNEQAVLMQQNSVINTLNKDKMKQTKKLIELVEISSDTSQ